MVEDLVGVAVEQGGGVGLRLEEGQAVRDSEAQSDVVIFTLILMGPARSLGWLWASSSFEVISRTNPSFEVISRTNLASVLFSCIQQVEPGHTVRFMIYYTKLMDRNSWYYRWAKTHGIKNAW